MFTKTLFVLIAWSPVLMIFAQDWQRSEITIVDNKSSYRATHPNARLYPFLKRYDPRGNYLFTFGKRISDDHLIYYIDEVGERFSEPEDIQVLLRCPAQGNGPYTITHVKIFATMTSRDADAFFIDKGLNLPYAKLLLTCNRTKQYSYTISVYGY